MDYSKRSAGAVAGLPDDPLVEILSRVPVKSLCRFKCVSKAWRDLIADPLHRKKLPQTLEGFFFLADSGSDDGGGEDGGDDHSGGDDGDGEDNGSDGGDGDGDSLERQAYGYFADAVGRSVRHVERCFPFLAEVRVPGIENIMLLHHCNGLLLFGIRKSDESLSYIVSNPATQQWIAVPSSNGESSPLTRFLGPLSSLIFDPAVSPHFHLVQIKSEKIPVQVYSSKSGVWTVRREWKEWGRDKLHTASGSCSAYVNGMLYVLLYGEFDRIAEMDVEGNTRKTIPLPLLDEDRLDVISMWTDYVGVSQGRLHCIYHAYESFVELPPEKQSYELFIWVLEDFQTQKWVLKDTVSLFHLFGKKIYDMSSDYNVVAIHPDCNLVYLVLHCDNKLISYNMDSKEVCHLFTLESSYHGGFIAPYVPCYLELPVLENMP